MNTKIFSILLLIAFIVNCFCQEHEVKISTSSKPDPSTKNSTTTTTTTTEKPTTTTEKPTTTTTHKPPTPAPNPTVNYVAGNITSFNKICLRYNFSLHMSLKYEDKNKTLTKEIDLPHDAIVGSDHCSNEQFESFWFEFDNEKSMLNLTFEKNPASVFLSMIHAKIFLSNKTYLEYNVTKPNPNFNVDHSHSYVCANNITIKSDQYEFTFSNVTMQAFMKPDANGAFSEEHNCQNEINDVVPIAVGAALTSLVVIVMIAYFIGRRRSRRLAYQSV